MKLLSLLPIALFFAAAQAAPPKPEPAVECTGIGSISVAADADGDFQPVCKCPKDTVKTLLYTLAGDEGAYFCAPK
ncbi:uncharacterized protein BDV14DRAFT_196135 [Aspergillus stella-maris]|uniref:uncharacterized protein n=1 Tax=Aspergillus stella-maris TaxID=1810926 RepID=UPI003CCE05B3